MMAGLAGAVRHLPASVTLVPSAGSHIAFLLAVCFHDVRDDCVWRRLKTPPRLKQTLIDVSVQQKHRSYRTEVATGVVFNFDPWGDKKMVVLCILVQDYRHYQSSGRGSESHSWKWSLRSARKRQGRRESDHDEGEKTCSAEPPTQ